MGNYIVKLKEHYLIWSSIADAPATYGMTRDELTEWTREEYGKKGPDELPARLARVDAKGTSALGQESAVSTIWLNRAGPDESCLTIEGIYRHYCLEEPVQEDWIVKGRVMGEEQGPSYADVVKGWEA